jgi:5-methyltetrahydrofolate--homocysteine methyltransferase
VPDASRSVSVAQSLLSDQAIDIDELNTDYDESSPAARQQKQTPMWPLAKAGPMPPMDWSVCPASAQVHGRRLFKISI